MNKSKSFIKALIVGTVLLLFGVGMFVFFLSKEIAKKSDGTPVTCTVTSVSKFGKTSYVHGYYTDDEGNQIEVELVNTVQPFEGAVVEAYLLPDKPGKAFLPNSLATTLLLIGVTAVFSIGGIAVIFFGFRDNADSKLLDLEGQFTQGRIINLRRDKYGSNNVVYVALIAYTDSNGIEHTFDHYSDIHKLSRIGDTVNVRYARRKSGKFANEVI